MNLDDDEGGPFKRRLWPKERKDQMAMASIFIGTPITLIFESTVILPKYLDFGTSEWWTHAAMGLFLAVNFIGNLYQIFMVDPSGKGADLPSVLRPGWRYCSRCKLNSPPRSYHCSVCDVCILKRDHHCSFAGICVGYHNHRYYLMSVVYALLGILYAMWWHWGFIWEILGGCRLGTIWKLFIPHLAFITLQISFAEFFLAGIQMSAIVGAILSAYLLGSQLFHIYRGSTQVEYRDGIRAYDLGPAANFRDVLGNRWLFALICPFLPSKLPGDGLKFQPKVEIENAKDL